MGLKCSLLGHSFDDADVEREREERGNEVVTVVKEVERCSRCDEVRVLSENKEVTSIVEPGEVGLDEAGDTGSSSTALGNMAAGAEDGSTGSGFESGSDLDEFESPGSPDEEDAEILEDNRPSDRQPGQWPDDEDDWDPGRLTRPDEPGENVVEDAADAAGEADETDDAEAAPDPEPTEADETDDGGDGGDGGDFIDAEADSANADADESASESSGAAGGISVPEGSLACPDCGFTTSAENTPLRAGDACPECQRGYLDAGE